MNQGHGDLSIVFKPELEPLTTEDSQRFSGPVKVPAGERQATIVNPWHKDLVRWARPR